MKHTIEIVVEDKIKLITTDFSMDQLAIAYKVGADKLKFDLIKELKPGGKLKADKIKLLENYHVISRDSFSDKSEDITILPEEYIEIYLTIVKFADQSLTYLSCPVETLDLLQKGDKPSVEPKLGTDPTAEKEGAKAPDSSSAGE